MREFTATVLVFFLVASWPEQANAQPAAEDAPPVAEFDVTPFISPAFDAPALSPDGKHVAVRRVSEGRPYLEVFRIENSESVAVYIMEAGLGVANYHWADERSLLIQIAYGDEFWTDGRNQGGWIRYDIITKKGDRLFQKHPRRMLAGRGLIGKLRIESFADVFVVDAFEDDGNDVRVMYPDRRVSWISRYDTRRDRYNRLADVPGDIFDAYSDRQGNVFATWGHPVVESSAVTFKDAVRLLYRNDPKADFKEALAGHIDDYDIDLVTDGPRDGTVYILENAKDDRIGLSVLDLNDGSIEPVFRPARTDVTTAFLDAERSLYAVRHDDHFPQFHYPNPEHPAAMLHRVGVTAFENMNVRIVSFARNAPLAIIAVDGDTEPGMYYVATLGSARLSGLFPRTRGVPEDKLGTRHPIEFPGDDGSRLTGYMTLPAGHAPGEAIAFIVLPSDELFPMPATWGFDGVSQFFASLGFGVLEVNARGTVGFGRDFQAAGRGQVASVVPQDIAAGLRYVVARGDADANRVCIVGRRFGAYAAVMSAIQKPSLYRCLVTVNGVYDVAGIRKALPIGGARERFTAQLGRPGDEDEAFREISPRYIASRISKPLLVVEAKQYSTSLPDQARDMIRAVKAGKVPHVVYEVETSRSNNMLTHAERRGAFERIAGFVLTHTRKSS